MQIDFSIVSENLARTYGDVITPHLLGGGNGIHFRRVFFEFLCPFLTH
jgi:hypothetical protein